MRQKPIYYFQNVEESGVLSLPEECFIFVKDGGDGRPLILYKQAGDNSRLNDDSVSALISLKNDIVKKNIEDKIYTEKFYIDFVTSDDWNKQNIFESINLNYIRTQSVGSTYAAYIFFSQPIFGEYVIQFLEVDGDITITEKNIYGFGFKLSGGSGNTRRVKLKIDTIEKRDSDFRANILDAADFLIEFQNSASALYKTSEGSRQLYNPLINTDKLSFSDDFGGIGLSQDSPLVFEIGSINELDYLLQKIKESDFTLYIEERRNDNIGDQHIVLKDDQLNHIEYNYKDRYVDYNSYINFNRECRYIINTTDSGSSFDAKIFEKFLLMRLRESVFINFRKNFMELRSMQYSSRIDLEDEAFSFEGISDLSQLKLRFHLKDSDDVTNSDAIENGPTFYRVALFAQPLTKEEIDLFFLQKTSLHRYRRPLYLNGLENKVYPKVAFPFLESVDNVNSEIFNSVAFETSNLTLQTDSYLGAVAIAGGDESFGLNSNELIIEKNEKTTIVFTAKLTDVTQTSDVVFFKLGDNESASKMQFTISKDISNKKLSFSWDDSVNSVVREINNFNFENGFYTFIINLQLDNSPQINIKIYPRLTPEYDIDFVDDIPDSFSNPFCGLSFLSEGDQSSGFYLFTDECGAFEESLVPAFVLENANKFAYISAFEFERFPFFTFTSLDREGNECYTRDCYIHNEDISSDTDHFDFVAGSRFYNGLYYKHNYAETTLDLTANSGYDCDRLHQSKFRDMVKNRHFFFGTWLKVIEDSATFNSSRFLRIPFGNYDFKITFFEDKESTGNTPAAFFKGNRVFLDGIDLTTGEPHYVAAYSKPLEDDKTKTQIIVAIRKESDPQIYKFIINESECPFLRMDYVQIGFDGTNTNPLFVIEGTRLYNGLVDEAIIKYCMFERGK